MKNTSITLIDPQVGFCLAIGSVARKYGKSQLIEIEKAVPKIDVALSECYRRHLVKSEYRPGQFTGGDLNQELSNLCVPFVNDDCQVLSNFNDIEFSSISVKNSQSALSSSVYCRALERDIAEGIKSFVVSGFLLNHCVKQTALDLSLKLKGSDSEVYVCSDLTAARLEKYGNGVVAETIAHLQSNGIKYVPWSKVQPYK